MDPSADAALRVAFRDVVRTIALALDMDERVKLNHATRVGLLSYEIGRSLGVPDAGALYYAGMLHDLGAIGLENHIVHQVARGLEGEDVRMHAERGARIVRPLAALRPYEDLIADHHERSDGRGFPRGKRGDEISLGASVVHVSDLLDLTLRSTARSEAPAAVRGLLLQVRGKAVPSRVAEAARDALADEELLAALTDDRTLASLTDSLCPPTPGLSRVTRVELISQLLWVLARVVDAKHSHTMGHSTRVAHLGYRIAGAFSDAVNAWDVAWAGLLHDVGKIGVPRSLLDKRGKLDPEEWSTVRAHAAGTGRIIDSIRDLSHLALPAASHHERYDGGGYPRGVDGESIPLVGRIIAYADMYDALTSARSYRGPLHHSEALTTIRAEVGRALDPHLADAAFAALQQWGPSSREGTDQSPFADFFECDDADIDGTFGAEARSGTFLLSAPLARLTTLEPWTCVEADLGLVIRRGGDSLAALTGSAAGDSLADHLDSESMATLEAAIATLAGEAWHTQYVVTTRGLPLEVLARRVEGRVTLLFRSAEHKQQSMERFALFYRNFLSSTEAVVFADPSARIVDVNQRFLDLFGFQREEVVGQSTRILQSGRQSPDVYREMWLAITDPTVGCWSGEIVDRKRNGEEVDVRLSIEAVRDAYGVCIGYVSHLVDISDRKRLEVERQLRQEELQRANEELLRLGRFKDDLIAVTSHDLRGPLAAIANVAGALRDGLSRMPHEEAVALLGRISETASRTTELVNDLLDLERAESGALELRPSRLRLEVLLAQCVDRARSASKKSIHFELRAPPGEQLVIGDALRLEQVFINLLGNAAKFSPGGSTVTVSVVAHDDRDMISIAVEDEGPGIPPEALSAIFDRFYQVKAAGKVARRGFGTGLGLNIVRNLVQLHGGTVRAENVSPEGCRFCVELPRRTGDERFSRPTSVVLARPSAETRMLLDVLGTLHLNTLWVESAATLRSTCALTAAELAFYDLALVDDDLRPFVAAGADQASGAPLAILLASEGEAAPTPPGCARVLTQPVLAAELREIQREVTLRRAQRIAE